MTEIESDPINRAASLWQEHFGDPTAMKVVSAVMRTHQVMLAELDSILRPFNITFARYEILVLLTFSKRGELPLGLIGERLMVHPTSVTSAIDRLEKQGLVRRKADPTDRRKTLAELTDQGKKVMAETTEIFKANEFGLKTISPDAQQELFSCLHGLLTSKQK